jgi:outer membrane autotransporter protein
MRPQLTPVAQRRARARGAWALLAILFVYAPLPADAQSSNPYENGSTIEIPYASGGLSSSPTINLGFDGSGTFAEFTMDTGSVGLVASPNYFQPGPDSHNLGTGTQTYTSSGRILHGTWWTATQQIYNDGAVVAEAMVPVLQVTSITCMSGFPDCTATTNPTDVHLMGVGFARESPLDPDPTTHGPGYNAFLNLTRVRLALDTPMEPLPAGWHSGYVVTSDHVSLGLTSGNTDDAGVLKLLPNPLYWTPSHREWAATPMSIEVNGTSGPGTVLTDTGVNSAYLIPPPGASIGPLVTCPGTSNVECAPDGTAIRIYIPQEGSGEILFYRFEVGDDSNPMQPDGVVIVDADTGTYFNTSRHVLSGLDYFFDAENGLVGYRWRSVSDTHGSVAQIVALQGPFETPDGFVTDLPAVLFAPTTLSSAGTGEFAGAISGSSDLTIDGPGTVVLSGNNSYSGTTAVAGGTLSVNGTIVSPVTVESGGTLGGTGIIDNDVTVEAGGVFAPGNSIGVQFVNGALSFGAGGILEVELNAAGASDELVVTGSVDLTGAALRLLIEPGNYNQSTSYLIIANDGADPVTGEFARIDNGLVFFVPTLDYDAGTGNEVMLTLELDPDFVGVAETLNQRAVAGALEGFSPTHPLYLAVLFQTLEGALQAFDALSGEVHASTSSVLADQSRYVREALLARLLRAASDGQDAVIAALGSGGPEPFSLGSVPMALGFSEAGLPSWRSPTNIAFWTRAYGAWGSLEGNGNAATASRNLAGFLSGADARLGSDWRLGIATGLSQSSIDVGARGSSASIDTVHLALYAGGGLGSLAVRSGGAWGFNHIETSRTVVFPGFLDRETASYGGDTGQLFAEAALPTTWGSVAAEPFLGTAYVHVGTDPFREEGGIAALAGAASSHDVGYSTLGLRLASVAGFYDTKITPRFSLAWQHAFGEITPAAALAFVSTGIGFGVLGVPLAQDSALVDATLDLALTPAAALELSYFGQFASEARDSAINGHFSWRF